MKNTKKFWKTIKNNGLVDSVRKLKLKKSKDNADELVMKLGEIVYINFIQEED